MSLKRFKNKDGYWVTKDPSTKNQKSNWSRYKPTHRLIAQKMLGRKLRRGEIVHHIDGVKTNNKKENLSVMNSSQHKLAHYSLEKIALKLYKVGLIEYRNKKYHISDALKEIINAEIGK